MQTEMDTEYFAAKQDPARVLDKLNKYIDDFYRGLKNRGRLYLWRQMYTHLYKARYTGGKVNKVGDQLEFKQLIVNHLPNILGHQTTMITQNRISFDARAVNSDAEAQVQAKFAVRLLDAETRSEKLDDMDTQMSKYANAYGEAWIKVCWDEDGGDVYIAGEVPVTDEAGQIVIADPGDPEQGIPPVPLTQPIERKYGKNTYKVYHPIDCIRDISLSSIDECKWFTFRDRVNRFDIIAKYAEGNEQLKRDILALPSCQQRGERDELVNSMLNDIEATSDFIYVYHFFHEKTEALPQGRELIFAGADVVLSDGPLKYDNVPVARMAGDEETGTVFGWSSLYDAASIQDALNKLYSIVASNQFRNGVGVVLVPKGSTFSAANLQKGMVVLEYDPRLGKPEALNLTLTPPEIFRFIQQLENALEKITSVSSVMRGDPSASVRSGNMLEIILAQNISFYKGLEKSRNSVWEKVGTMIIRNYRRYAEYQRPAELIGKNGLPYLKYFKKEDLSKIDKVYIEQANPAQKTFAGKLAIAKDLLQNGAIKDPREFINLVNTGNLDSTIDPDTYDFFLIQEENEMIMAGQLPMVSPTDYIAAHGYHHSVLLASPQARSNPVLTNMALQHCGEHAMMAGFIIPPPMVPILDEKGFPVIGPDGAPLMQPQMAPVPGPDGEPILNPDGSMVMQPVPPKPDLVSFFNWCRMIMNAPPSGAMQMAQMAMNMGANGMAPNAPKIEPKREN